MSSSKPATHASMIGRADSLGGMAWPFLTRLFVMQGRLIWGFGILSFAAGCGLDPVVPEPPSPQIRGVFVEPTGAGVRVGQSKQFTAVVVADARASESVEWSTGNSNIATVTESGLVLGVSPGVTGVTARSTVDRSKAGGQPITVFP